MPITKENGYAGRTFVSTSSSIEGILGYSRAVRDGDWIFVSNTSGTNFDTNSISDNLVEQAQQMLINIEDALKAANGTFEDIVQANLYVAEPGYLPEIRPIISRLLKRARPALTAICTPLAHPDLKVEMAVTARLNNNS